MRHGNSLLLVLAMALAPAVLAVAAPEDQQSAKVEFFESKVRPIFAQHCAACHSADTKPSGGLRVDDRQGLLIRRR
jgi:mono/diheme cytochrome c family protein